MLCKNCGQKIKDSLKSCGSCGAPVEQDATENHRESIQTTEILIPLQIENIGQKKKKGIIITIIALIVCAIIELGLCWCSDVFPDVDKTSSSTSTTKEESGKKYDDNGNIIEEPFSIPNGVSGTFRYEYDADGNRTKTSYYDADLNIGWYTTFKYDTNGNLINETGYLNNGNINDSHDFDSDGNEIKTTYYENGKMNSCYTYEYDADGNRTKTSYYDKNGKLKSVSESVSDGFVATKTTDYDENGNVICISESTFDGDLISMTSYDENGNIIDEY